MNIVYKKWNPDLIHTPADPTKKDNSRSDECLFTLLNMNPTDCSCDNKITIFMKPWFEYSKWMHSLLLGEWRLFAKFLSHVGVLRICLSQQGVVSLCTRLANSFWSLQAPCFNILFFKRRDPETWDVCLCGALPIVLIPPCHLQHIPRIIYWSPSINSWFL